MVKVSVKLDKRYRLASGNYPVKIVVARAGKTLYVPLNIDVAEEDWVQDARDNVKNRKDKRTLNTYIHSRLSQVEIALVDLQTKGELRNYSNRQLVDYLSSDKVVSKSTLLSAYFDKVLATISKIRTRAAYKNTISAITAYCDYDSLYIEEIDKEWVDNFVQHLRAKGLKTNSIISYLAPLRKVYKAAYDNGIVSSPFPRCSMKRETTRKRSIYIEQLRLLYNIKLSGTEEKYRDLFFIIFFLVGINMADLFNIKSVDNGRIQYKRRKTGRDYDIKVEPEAQELIDKYRGKQHLLSFFDGKPEGFCHHIGSYLSIYMRQIASRLGIDIPITAYWARHSWASLAIELDIPMEVVSYALGHSFGNQTTAIYIKFNQKKVDKANRKVIDYLLDKK